MADFLAGVGAGWLSLMAFGSYVEHREKARAHKRWLREYDDRQAAMRAHRPQTKEADRD